MIHKAIIFATAAHENQKRKGADIPYILHPMEAAVIVSQIKYDSDLICAALHYIVLMFDTLASRQNMLETKSPHKDLTSQPPRPASQLL